MGNNGRVLSRKYCKHFSLRPASKTPPIAVRSTMPPVGQSGYPYVSRRAVVSNFALQEIRSRVMFPTKTDKEHPFEAKPLELANHTTR